MQIPLTKPFKQLTRQEPGCVFSPENNLLNTIVCFETAHQKDQMYGTDLRLIATIQTITQVKKCKWNLNEV